MAFDFKQYQKYLNNPYSLDKTNWAKWKKDYEKWKGGQLASLSAAERKAKDQYGQFTTQARNQLTQAVQQVKSAVDRNALARGLSYSTIPGTVIGSETERMNKEYEKQDAAAKSSLEQTIKGIQANRSQFRKLDARTGQVDKAVSTYTPVDPKVKDALLSKVKIDDSSLKQMTQIGVPDYVLQYKKQDLQKEAEAAYDKKFKEWAKGTDKTDLNGYSPSSKGDTLGDAAYWGERLKYESMIDAINYNFDKDQKSRQLAYSNILRVVPEDIRQHIAPAAAHKEKLDVDKELKKYTTEKTVDEYLKKTGNLITADNKKVEDDYAAATGITGVPSDQIKIPNINWGDAGFYYGADEKDQIRKQYNLPPASAMKLYDTPGGKQRLKEGKLPQQFEVLANVQKEYTAFQKEYQTLALDGKATNEAYTTLLAKYPAMAQLDASAKQLAKDTALAGKETGSSAAPGVLNTSMQWYADQLKNYGFDLNHGFDRNMPGNPWLAQQIAQYSKMTPEQKKQEDIARAMPSVIRENQAFQTDLAKLVKEGDPAKVQQYVDDNLAKLTYMDFSMYGGPEGFKQQAVQAAKTTGQLKNIGELAASLELDPSSLNADQIDYLDRVVKKEIPLSERQSPDERKKSIREGVAKFGDKQETSALPNTKHIPTNDEYIAAIENNDTKTKEMYEASYKFAQENHLVGAMFKPLTASQEKNLALAKSGWNKMSEAEKNTRAAMLGFLNGISMGISDSQNNIYALNPAERQRAALWLATTDAAKRDVPEAYILGRQLAGGTITDMMPITGIATRTLVQAAIDIVKSANDPSYKGDKNHYPKYTPYGWENTPETADMLGQIFGNSEFLQNNTGWINILGDAALDPLSWVGAGSALKGSFRRIANIVRKFKGYTTTLKEAKAIQTAKTVQMTAAREAEAAAIAERSSLGTGMADDAARAANNLDTPEGVPAGKVSGRSWGKPPARRGNPTVSEWLDQLSAGKGIETAEKPVNASTEIAAGAKALEEVSPNLAKPFELGDNTTKIKGLNADAVTNAAIESMGRAPADGDLVVIQTAGNKAIDARLFDSNAVKQLPEGSVLFKAEGVGHDGKNLIYTRVPRKELESLGLTGAGEAGRVAAQAGKEGGEVESIYSNIYEAAEGSGNSWYKGDGSLNLPPNYGAVKGTEKIVNLQPGSKLGRFGVYGKSSDFVTAPGSAAETLSLPPYTDTSIYHEFTVLKPIPGVTQSTVASWGGSAGGGIQLRLPMPIEELIRQGYLRK